MSTEAQVTVRLTPAQVQRVMLRARQTFRQSKGRTVFEPDRGYDLPRRHIEGEGARVALATWLGRTELPAGMDKYVTPNANGGIILREPVTLGVVLVGITGALPEYVLGGWVTSADVVDRGEWWAVRSPGGWYFPLDELHGMHTLPDDLKATG